jgi:hypothetical protein
LISLKYLKTTLDWKPKIKEYWLSQRERNTFTVKNLIFFYFLLNLENTIVFLHLIKYEVYTVHLNNKENIFKNCLTFQQSWFQKKRLDKILAMSY